MALAFWAELMAIKNALSKFCKRRGKARTTGFTDSPFGGWHFPKHRNKRVPLMLSPDFFFASVCRSGGSVSDGIEVPTNHSWYDVVRRSDGAIICSFPAEGRHLIYRVNGIISMRPLLPEEEVFTLNGFMKLPVFCIASATESSHLLII